MGADITAFIQIDDNTPPEQPPFTYDPSTWDLRWDLGLCGCKDYRFYAAISGIRNDTPTQPLFDRRGLPSINNDHDPVLALQDELDDTYVSWLTLAEIRRALDHMKVGYDSLSKHVLRVLECMATLERLLGQDRVRLVFSVHD